MPATLHTSAILAASVLAAAAAVLFAQQPAASNPATPPADILSLTVNRIDGSPQPLADYKGKVILIVNVASRCGFTPQYEGLQKLYAAKMDQGFVVLGFPANDFGSQEPGTNQEISEFCRTTFDVDFPMFEKIPVKGPQAHPLYQALAQQPAPVGGEPRWNFTKFLVDRSGKVVGRYEPSIKPDDPTLTAKIDELLAATP
ncbi:MAG: glutathione peroxidase [Planctomycetota bacterium]|nr:glutathione peroxidase [Planctomycetota bacterium]